MNQDHLSSSALSSDSPVSNTSGDSDNRRGVGPWAWVLVIGLPLILVLLGAIGLFLTLKDEKESSKVRIEIRESKTWWGWLWPSDDGLSVIRLPVKGDRRKPGTSISYKLKDGAKERFIVEDSIDDDVVAEYISTLEDNNLYSPFDVQENPRIVDITFDISGSIRTLMQQRPNYREDIVRRLDETLRENNIRPGDRVRVRFLGGNPRVVSDVPYVINIIGPKFDYSVDFQRATNKRIVQLKNYQLDYDVPQNAARSLKELRDKLRSKYLDTTNNLSSFGNRTYLIGHLNKIIRQNGNEKFSSILYVVLTDGEFNIENDIANRVGVSYSDPGTYKVAHPKLTELVTRGIILKQDHNSGEALTKDLQKDKVVFLGFNNYNSDDYQNSAESLFKAIFDQGEVHLL